MIRNSCLLFLCLLFGLLKSQPTHGLLLKCSFDKAAALDEITGQSVKAIGTTLVEDRFGNKRSACYLHGTFDSYINLGTSPRLKPRAASISLWFDMETKVFNGSGFDVNPVIITKSHEGDDFFEGYSVLYDLNVNKLIFSTTMDQSRQVSLRSSEKITLRKWHHVVIAYDDKYLWAYIDGVLQNDGKPMLKEFTSKFLATDSVMLGNTANRKNHRFFCGSVDDILIYGRVLSPEEVSELYRAKDPNRLNIYLKWLWRVLAIAFVLVLIMWLVAKRYERQLERQKEKNRLDARLAELETKAIRSQMNPHFIFNSLNTAITFVLEDDKNKAYNYLVDFSILLRKLLESGESDMISLKEEMEILNSYIQIEELRFDNSFEYELRSDIRNPEQVYIPFMLIQPFVENSIWHGLLHKEGNRKLKIHFFGEEEKAIRCCIEDNGVGRNYGKNDSPYKKKSMAIDLISQRLELLSRSVGIRCSLEIRDLKESGQPSGTVVEILIPRLR